MRILVVANLYPSPANPAFGTFVAARVAGLRRAGHRVEVVAIRDDRTHQQVARKYLRLGIAALTSALLSTLAGHPPRIVEAHIAFPTGLVAWPVARLLRARLVLFCHGSDVTRLPWQSTRRTRAARWLFGQADLVIANSRYIADVVTERLGPTRRPPVVITPGIEPPAPSRPAVDAASGEILFVGRLVAGKGLDILLEAVERLGSRMPDVRVTVVGDGPLRAEAERRVAARHLPVTFAGPLPPTAVDARMRSAAVVAVPATDPEGLGLVALEAMARGAIVVATRVGGLAEIIEDGVTAIAVPPGDAAALADALARAMALVGAPAGATLQAGGHAMAARHDLGRAIQRSVEEMRAVLA